MNRRTATPGDDTHQAAQQLLPWLLAGTLEGAERQLVQEHLFSCERCRAELEWQRNIRAAGQPAPPLDVEHALGRLLPRLGPQQARSAGTARWRDTLAANDNRWWQRTAALQFAVIAVLAVLLLRPLHQVDGYRGLGADAPAHADLVVVFRPDTPEHELRRIVQAHHAHVVDGPTVTAAYLLDVPAEHTASALAGLRAEPAVILAQPLATGSRP
jgi:anti-sigma factor RsiW